MRKLAIIFVILILLVSARLEAAQLKLAFVGDILVARHVGRNIQSLGIKYPFAASAPELKNCDIAFGNFECTLFGKQITGSNKLLVFRAPKEFAQSVSSGGISIVSLANNHMLDAGRQGVSTTLQALHQAGVKTVGAGYDSREAYSPQFYNVKGETIGFLAFTDLSNAGLINSEATINRPGVAIASDTKLLRQIISETKKKCDILIVSFHFGNEYQTKPSTRQKLLTNLAINAGADTVIGHHPHVLQPVTKINGKTVAYSLGNFVFDNHKPSRARTEILVVNYDTNTGKQEYQLLPYYIRNCQPRPL